MSDIITFEFRHPEDEINCTIAVNYEVHKNAPGDHIPLRERIEITKIKVLDADIDLITEIIYDKLKKELEEGCPF